jgi:cyclophilin family peptidyl-prolyl cis-trans isomerase
MRTLLIGLTLTAALFAQTSTSSTTTKTKSSTAKSKSKTAAAPAAANPTVVHPIAIFDTTMGKMTCGLYPDKAPKTVANFIGLANGSKDWKHPFTAKDMKGTPLYDGTTFHRVIPNFMIQGGDPIGNGTGNPGYAFEDEFSPDLRFDRPGRLAMANSGPATNGSQFFITEVPTPHLNDRHTIFGQCDDASVDLVRKIARVATDPRNNMPLEPVKITHISIQEPGKPAAKPSTSKSKAGTKSKSTTKSKASTATQPK